MSGRAFGPLADEQGRLLPTAVPMLDLCSPLSDATNAHNMAEEGAPCFLSLLAEASLERSLHDAKRPKTLAGPGCVFAAGGPRLECGEALGAEGGEGRAVGAKVFAVPLEATAVRTRCPSRHSADSSRSTSPASSGGSASGKSYLCNHCGREYASTDAVRKHARQNHPEWLKAQGQGCPSLYCTVVEATGPADKSGEAAAGSFFFATAAELKGAAATPPPMVATAVTAAPAFAAPAARPVAALSVSAAAGAGVAPPAPSPADPAAAHLLMNAAESCLALSMAAHAEESDDEYADEDAYPAERIAALMRAGPQVWAGGRGGGAGGRGGGAGQKRPRVPRSVRCGNCDGCTRDDCGMCKNCVDKPKFGGLGQRKQGCVRKICRAPVPAP